MIEIMLDNDIDISNSYAPLKTEIQELRKEIQELRRHVALESNIKKRLFDGIGNMLKELLTNLSKSYDHSSDNDLSDDDSIERLQTFATNLMPKQLEDADIPSKY